MAKYTLNRPWFDGRIAHKRGAVVEIAEGLAPSTATRHEDPAPEVEPELDLAPAKPAAKPVAKAAT